MRGATWHPYLCKPIEGMVEVEVARVGRPTSWAMAMHGVPVVSREVANALQDCAGWSVQIVKADVVGAERFVVNCLSTVDCMDAGASNAVELDRGDRRRSAWRRWDGVRDVRLLADRVPADIKMFRVDGWRMALVGHQDVVDAIATMKCDGLEAIEAG